MAIWQQRSNINPFGGKAKVRAEIEKKKHEELHVVEESLQNEIDKRGQINSDIIGKYK